MNLDYVSLAADSARMQGGGKSIFEKVGDAMTAGAAGAVVSGLGSIYNTGVWASNSVFGTTAEELDTGKVLGQVNTDWQRYYDENKDVIDTVGFIGGSFIPGGIAVKGLNAARAGRSAGVFRSALGYTMHKQQDFLEAGLKEIATKGPDVFGTLNKNKLLSMAFGTADNVLQTAVFETAAAVAMHRAPIFNNESWSDISWDIAKTSLVGGLFGGGIEALWTNKIYRNAGKLVEGKSRAYDVINQLERTNLGLGDKAFATIDSVLDLPAEVLAADKVLKFKYRLNGKDNPIELDTSALLDRQLRETVRRGEQTFQKSLTEAVAGDTSVGSPFAKAMLEVIADGKSRQLSNGEIKEQLLTYLGNLESIQGMAASRVDFTKDVFYVAPGAKLIATEKIDAPKLFSSTRQSNKDTAYRLVGNLEEARSGIVGTPGVGTTVKDAFAKGYDVVFSGNTGKLHINPASKVFKQAESPSDPTLRVTFNTRTKITSDNAVPTIADVAKAGAPVVTEPGITAGTTAFKFQVGRHENTLDSVQNTARHLWAANVKDLKGVTINEQDFSLLDRIIADPTLADKTTKIRLRDGSLEELPVGGIRRYVLQKKLEEAQRIFAEEGADVDHRLISYKLNAEQKWVQDAVSVEFRQEALDVPQAFRELESYAARDNVVLVYKKPPISNPDTPDFPTGQLAYEYRKTLALQQANYASSAVLGQAGERYLDLDPRLLSRQADATGVGPTGAGFSNADYTDPLRLWAQDTGRATSLTSQQFTDAALNQLQPHMAKLITNGNTEVGAVLNRIRFSEDRMAIVQNRLVTLSDFKKYRELEAKVLAGEAKPADLASMQFRYNYELREDTAAFLQAYQDGHRTWLSKHGILARARGTVTHWDEDALYLPPLNTRKVPYFAFVRAQEGRIFGSSETVMITAKTAEDLQAKARKIEAQYPDMQVLFKDDTELFRKAQGDYEYTKSLNSPQIDPLLRKQGLLGDFIPTVEPKAVMEEFVTYVARREQDLVRNAVELKYGQTFSELEWLSSQYTRADKSKFGFMGKLDVKKIQDPFGDYKRLALNVSKRSEYTLWSNINEFVDALGSRAYGAVEESFRRSKAGEITWQQANADLEKFGLGGVFTSQADYLAAQTGADRSLVKIAVAKANMLLANVALRLDTANALVNIVSTPILLGTEVSAIRSSIKNDPKLAALFEQQFSESVPGQQMRVPSTVRLLANAVKNYFGKDKAELINRYEKTIGSIRSDNAKFHDMIEDLALTPQLVPSAWSAKVDGWMEKGATLTGNNMAEQFTRFVASDVMRQITQPVVEAGRMSVKEQNAFIAIFVNRTQGNYLSSQRPIMFQGTLGAALGLFQTYQFNLFQQLFRHIEDKNGKTLAVAAGLQATLFGMNGLPLFDAINTHIIGNANINDQHKDIYSSVAAADKEWGDFAMYGMSAFPMFGDKAPSLYTRGDLNPRHVTIVPTNFSQIPAVEGFSRILKSVWGVGNQVANGGGFGDAMLHGLEHNGVSRPLAGLAQVLKGSSTTSQGSLISANVDMLSIASGTRLLGAKPMDESVALNHKFRMVAYEQADKQRIEALGVPIKDKIRNGDLTPEDVEDFASRYAAAGGRMQSYGAAMQRWMRDANQSVLNTATKAHSTARSQRLFEVMGGDPLPDFYNTPKEEPAQ